MDDVGRGMPSPHLGSTHSRTTSGVACHHSPWIENTTERRRALHDITTLGQHIWSVTSCVAGYHLLRTVHTVGNVGRGMTSPPLDKTQLNDVGCGMPYRLLATHSVGRHRAWHAIITFRKHKRSNDVRRGMPSSPLDGKHGQTKSGVACHHHL